MNVADVMDDLADQLDTIAGLRVHAYHPGSISPPAAVVGFPETYEYDSTYGRGMDRMSVPVWVLVGKVQDRSSRDLLSGYMDGSGAESFKAVLEAGTYTAFDSLRVESVEVSTITVGAVEYLGAAFLVDVVGSGA